VLRTPHYHSNIITQTSVENSGGWLMEDGAGANGFKCLGHYTNMSGGNTTDCWIHGRGKGNQLRVPSASYHTTQTSKKHQRRILARLLVAYHTVYHTNISGGFGGRLLEAWNTLLEGRAGWHKLLAIGLDFRLHYTQQRSFIVFINRDCFEHYTTLCLFLALSRDFQTLTMLRVGTCRYRCFRYAILVYTSAPRPHTLAHKIRLSIQTQIEKFGRLRLRDKQVLHTRDVLISATASCTSGSTRRRISDQITVLGVGFLIISSSAYPIKRAIHS
jgi:hypothetical protein